MEYSDYLIPSAEEFAKMSKEYFSRLEKEKGLEGDVYLSQSSIILNNLVWIYNYIKKNIRSSRLKSIFLNMEEKCKEDLKNFKDNQPNKIRRSQKFNNFQSCLKYAISNEAELVKNLHRLITDEETINRHLDFIKELATF